MGFGAKELGFGSQAASTSASKRGFLSISLLKMKSTNLRRTWLQAIQMSDMSHGQHSSKGGYTCRVFSRFDGVLIRQLLGFVLGIFTRAQQADCFASKALIKLDFLIS